MYVMVVKMLAPNKNVTKLKSNKPIEPQFKPPMTVRIDDNLPMKFMVLSFQKKHLGYLYIYDIAFFILFSM